MRALSRFALVIVLLAACGGDGPLAPGRFTVEGRWLGRTYPYELSLDLAQDRENRVTGTGLVRGLAERVRLDTVEVDPLRVDTVAVDTVVTASASFAVGGRWSFPAVDLVLTAPGTAPAELALSFVTRDNVPLADSLAGRLSGSGFGIDIRLGRLP